MAVPLDRDSLFKRLRWARRAAGWGVGTARLQGVSCLVHALLARAVLRAA